jgi:ABC-type molybdate transport system substrate-binding protein
MRIRRRGFLTAAAVAPMIAISATASAEPTDLALTCDTAAAPAIERAAQAYRAKTGIRVHVHPTAPGLIVPQMQREIQNDILVSTPATLDKLEQAGLIQPGGRTSPWRNRLVVGATQVPAGPDGSFAAPDPTPGSDIDGMAIAQRLGKTAVLGVIDTAAVAWLLTNGGARQGLLHQTEVAADDRLHATAPVPDDVWPPILYAATVTKLSSRPDPGAFVAFLGSPDGLAALRDAALEIAA